MRYGLKDRIVDFVRNFCDKHNFKKENLLDILIAVGLSALIAFAIASGVSPNVDAIYDEVYWLSQTDQEILDSIGLLDDQDAAAILALHGINATVSGHVATINDLAALIHALQYKTDNIICSPPEAYLTGEFGNYTLCAKSSKSGNFTSNVHMVYSPPIVAGNATNYTDAAEYFYIGINWTMANYLYTPSISFNGTAWGISEVSFNIGTFMLEANAEALIDIKCYGLSLIASYAYVEVYHIQ